MGTAKLLYLIPSAISIYLGACLAILSIYKSRRRLHLLFSLVCFVWVLSPVAQLAHLFVNTTENHILIERVIHGLYCFSPLIHILFFHSLLNLRRFKLNIAVFFTGTFFSILTFTDFYISGLKILSWGPIAVVGPGFFGLLIFSSCVFIYILSIAVNSLLNEQNHILKLKLRYAVISVVFAYLLTVFNTLPLMGYDIYPLANFIFIPMLFLAYGILRYRLLDITSFALMALQYCLEFFLLAVPNLAILIICRKLIVKSPALPLGIAGAAWFYINYFYIRQTRKFIHFFLNTSKTRLKKAEARFIESILLLKDIDSLIEQFIKVLYGTLNLTISDFFIKTPENDNLLTQRGKKLEIDTETIAWFVRTKHLVEKNMVSTNPYYDPNREQLIKIFQDHNCSIIIPMVQYDELVGLVLFNGKSGGITRNEVQFINNIKKFVVIALYNAITYQNITGLKEALEEKTEALSAEIIERKKTEEILIESEARYRLLAENIFDTICVIDLADLTLGYVSPSVKKLLDYSADELTGSSITKVLSPESLKAVNAEISKALTDFKVGRAKPVILTIELIKKDSSTVWAEFSTYLIRNENHEPVSVIGVARDITERIDAEKEKAALESKLRQAQKMESIGILAGGIAHDFNNILMAILGYTQLATMYIPDKADQAIEKIKQIEASGKRAKELVSQILAFSRQSTQKKVSIKLETIVSEAVSMLSSSIPSTIKISTDFDAGLPPACVDPIQIHQIVINLCTNSYHAMEDKGGECRIRLSNKEINNQDGSLLEIKPGYYIEIDITDTGKGIAPEIIDKIFDPYFTTKEIGRGTGMGLAMVHGIVMSHNGAITVESDVEKGTTFKIYIPSVSAPETDKTEKKEVPQTGKEKILFVDDEEVLVELTQESMENLGYDIVAGTNPVQALKQFADAPESFDILVTDYTMPEMTGIALAEAVHKIRENLPIILCTGYSDPVSKKVKQDTGISEILQKPLSISELSAAIRKILNR